MPIGHQRREGSTIGSPCSPRLDIKGFSAILQVSISLTSYNNLFLADLGP